LNQPVFAEGFELRWANWAGYRSKRWSLNGLDRKCAGTSGGFPDRRFQAL